MSFQPAAISPFEAFFETPPSSPSSVHHNTDNMVRNPHIIMSYNDPTCNNISLYTFGSHHLNDEVIRPQFIGVSTSDNPYFSSTYNNNDEYDKTNVLSRVAETSTQSPYVPKLRSILSCNGLLGLVTHRHLEHGSARTEFQVRIINPVTSESLELLPATPDRFRTWVGFGLGFDPDSNDNFVIRLCHSHSFNKHNRNKKNNYNPHPECLPYHVSGSSVNVVEVLSLRHVECGWKSVMVNCHSVPWAHALNPVGLGGSLHWMIHDLPKPEEYDYYNADSDYECGGAYRQDVKHINYSSLLIAKFDLKKTKLTTFPGPPVTGGSGGYNPNGWGPKLMEHNGCLSLVVNMGYSTDIWVMKQHGVKESWTKHVSMSLNSYSTKQPHVLCMLGDDQVLVLRSSHLLELYDPKTKTYKIFRLSTLARLAHMSVLNPSLSPLC